MRTAFFLVMLSLAAIPARAQIPVEVISTSNDTVGQRLVYYLKEGIRTSSSMTLTFDDRVRLQVMVVTLDQDSRSPGYSTAYSVVLVWKNPAQPLPFYLTNYVGYCGSSRVRECADSLVANVYQQGEEVIRILRAVSK